jgi:ABC-type dipeptide/oligopeptide/nickel transport system permease component
LWEKGGSEYRGTIVRTYTEGQLINAVVVVSFCFLNRLPTFILIYLLFILFFSKITADHRGYFQFGICNVDGWGTDATQACLDSHLLSGN